MDDRDPHQRARRTLIRAEADSLKGTMLRVSFYLWWQGPGAGLQ